MDLPGIGLKHFHPVSMDLQRVPGVQKLQIVQVAMECITSNRPAIPLLWFTNPTLPQPAVNVTPERMNDLL
jgi:hypothetical protein